MMREAHLTRPRQITAADERDLAHRVVRRAKGPLGDGTTLGRNWPATE